MLSFLYNKVLHAFYKGKTSKGGRYFLGRVCIVGRSLLKKKRYLKLDFYRRINSFGHICKLMYDLNRTSKVGLLLYKNGLMSCIILTENLKFGGIVYSGDKIKNLTIKGGDALPLKYMNLFSLVNNIELRPYHGAQLVRASGGSCVFIGKTQTQGVLKLKSGWQVKVPIESISTLGTVSIGFKKPIGKAGKCRNMGFRPKVRGVAKNPCDHAHGGGNGKRSKPKVPVNASVTMFKWRPTTNKKKERLKRSLFKKLV